jgi:hypothetical protein
MMMLTNALACQPGHNLYSHPVIRAEDRHQEAKVNHQRCDL